jgi:hypothetical protein
MSEKNQYVTTSSLPRLAPRNSITETKLDAIEFEFDDCME